MQHQLVGFILTYGYTAIFACVFLHELGIPGPPNELLLLSVGIAAKKYQLGFTQVMMLVIAADIASACVLYFLFYRFGNIVSGTRLRWLQKLLQKVEKLKTKIGDGNGNALLLTKLIPFVRGYVPVAAGLMQINPIIYFRIVLITACIWSGGWVTAGWLLSV